MESYLCLSLQGLRGFRHGLELCQGCQGVFCSCLPTLLRCWLCREMYCPGCQPRLTRMDFCGCLVCSTCLAGASLEEHGSQCRRYRVNYRFNLWPLVFPELIEHITQFLWTDPPLSAPPPLLALGPETETFEHDGESRATTPEVSEATGQASNSVAHDE